MSEAQALITALGLVPHPEGGRYAETYRSGDRALSAIYFLLQQGERSHWHRVDADEVWLWHAGAPLTLKIAATEAGPARARTLGPDLATGRPQAVVPAGHWQAARSLGAYTLVSCIVAPAFRFEGFDLAPPDFDIPAG